MNLQGVNNRTYDNQSIFTAGNRPARLQAAMTGTFDVQNGGQENDGTIKYGVKKGEYWYNIVKEQYGVTDNKTIKAIVKQLKELNGVNRLSPLMPKEISLPGEVDLGDGKKFSIKAEEQAPFDPSTMVDKAEFGTIPADTEIEDKTNYWNPDEEVDEVLGEDVSAPEEFNELPEGANPADYELRYNDEGDKVYVKFVSGPEAQVLIDAFSGFEGVTDFRPSGVRDGVASLTINGECVIVSTDSDGKYSIHRVDNNYKQQDLSFDSLDDLQSALQNNKYSWGSNPGVDIKDVFIPSERD